MLIKSTYKLKFLLLTLFLTLGVISAGYADTSVYLANGSTQNLVFRLRWGANDGIGPDHHDFSKNITINTGQSGYFHSAESGITGNVRDAELCVKQPNGSWEEEGVVLYDLSDGNSYKWIYKSDDNHSCKDYKSNVSCDTGSDTNMCNN